MVEGSNGVSASFRLREFLRGRKSGPVLELGLGDVVLDGLGGGEVEADGAAAGAFLRDAEGGAVRVLVEVLDAKPAAGGEAGPGVEVELEDGPVAVIEDRVAGREAHELAGAGGGEGAGFPRGGRRRRGRGTGHGPDWAP